MDKPSSQDTNNNNQYLKNLNINKLSHKISKPVKKQSLDQNNVNPTPQPPPPPQNSSQNQNQQQHQPPVYNINKNDFRDVVQKLTGSPAHDNNRFSAPPPIHPPKPPSSRLQRIRPPPLAQLSSRPPPLLNSAISNSLHFLPPNSFPHRPVAPLSPLPPLPPHAAAESPVSAYMRYMQSFIPAVDSKAFAGFAPVVSPRWNNQNQPPPVAPPSPTFAGPSSPAPFGCLNSPYGLLSPGLLVSPSPFPLSPTVAVPSPKWRGV